MRNLHNILLQEDGLEAKRLFRLWEKLILRASKYKNHRIFTLRCLQNDLIPVSIKLKSSLKVARANKILRKAQKELLQTRIKSINYILDNTSKQLEECRSQLAAIISTQRLKECQDFVDKVGEIRFNKVKLRQLNKFNLLTIRKEGNITRSNNTNTNNLTLQANSQVNQISSQARGGSTPPWATTPPGEGNSPSQAGTPPGDTSTSLATLQANSQDREGGAPPQAGTLPAREDNSLSQASTPLPPGEASASPATAVLPVEGNSSSQATALLPSVEGNSSSNSLSSTQAGQISNPTSSSRQGNRCPPRHRSTQASQEVNTTSWEGNTPSTFLLGLPRVHLLKNLTLSGSSTSPTNL